MPIRPGKPVPVDKLGNRDLVVGILIAICFAAVALAIAGYDIILDMTALIRPSGLQAWFFLLLASIAIYNLTGLLRERKRRKSIHPEADR